MLAAVERIRAQRKTAMLTNNLSPMDPTTPIAQRLLPLFDAVVQSAVEGMRKPDPRCSVRLRRNAEARPV